jgi:UDP-glucose 4-epimerase
MKNILILGGNGYVGSRLRQVLKETYNIHSIDCCWFSYDEEYKDHRDYHRLTKQELKEFDVVIVLAGHSSVPSCNGDLYSPWMNNVSNFVDLLGKIDDQLVIYASSASVYGNSEPGEQHSEDNKVFVPVNNYDVTKYALDQQAIIANLTGKRVIGLRFGTVNGWSPNLRCDVMINAMYHTAVTSSEDQHITITNKHISRAILGIEDLCRAVTSCIEKQHAGIYNLASFNDNVGNIAIGVANKIDAKIIDKGNTMNAYDFAISTELFEKTYNFKFTESVTTIVDSLVNRYKEATVQYRNNYIIYQWETQRG